MHRFPEIIKHNQQFLYQFESDVFLLFFKILWVSVAQTLRRTRRVTGNCRFFFQMLNYFHYGVIMMEFWVKRRNQVLDAPFWWLRGLMRYFILFLLQVVLKVFEYLIDLSEGKLLPIIMFDILINPSIFSKLVRGHIVQKVFGFFFTNATICQHIDYIRKLHSLSLIHCFEFLEI